MQIKESLAPSFLEGQRDLKKWLEQAELPKHSEPAIAGTTNEIDCIKPHLSTESVPEEGSGSPNLIGEDIEKGNLEDPDGFGDEGDGKGFFDDMHQESDINENECDASSTEEGEEDIECSENILEDPLEDDKRAENVQKSKDLIDENVSNEDLDEDIRDEEEEDEEENNPDDGYEEGYY